MGTKWGGGKLRSKDHPLVWWNDDHTEWTQSNECPPQRKSNKEKMKISIDFRKSDILPDEEDIRELHVNFDLQKNKHFHKELSLCAGVEKVDFISTEYFRRFSNRYKVTIEKGSRFSWDMIEDQIVEILLFLKIND